MTKPANTTYSYPPDSRLRLTLPDGEGAEGQAASTRRRAPTPCPPARQSAPNARAARLLPATVPGAQGEASARLSLRLPQ